MNNPGNRRLFWKILLKALGPVYYRFLFNTGRPGAGLAACWVAYLECRAGSEDIPARKESWESQYAAGRYHHAVLLAALGRFDEALDELGAALGLEKTWAKKAKDAPEFSSLRNDQRFLDILK